MQVRGKDLQLVGEERHRLDEPTRLFWTLLLPLRPAGFMDSFPGSKLSLAT